MGRAGSAHLSSDGLRRPVGRRRRLGHGRGREGRVHGHGRLVQLARDDVGVRRRRGRVGAAGAAAGRQQARRVQLDGVVVRRRRARHRVVVWRFLLHRLLVWHWYNVDWIVNLELKRWTSINLILLYFPKFQLQSKINNITSSTYRIKIGLLADTLILYNMKHKYKFLIYFVLLKTCKFEL